MGAFEPDVPIVAGTVGNLEAEIGGWSRNVPVAQGLAQEVAFEIIGHLRLKVLTRLRPVLEKTVQFLEMDEEVPCVRRSPAWPPKACSSGRSNRSG